MKPLHFTKGFNYDRRTRTIETGFPDYGAGPILQLANVQHRMVADGKISAEEAELEIDRFGVWAARTLREARGDASVMTHHDLQKILTKVEAGSEAEIILRAALGLETESVTWKTRGIGLNSGIPDLVTGEIYSGARPDVSGFVFSKPEGELAERIFGGRAYVDYRPSEPGWLQVKVSGPENVLEELCKLVRANDHKVTAEIVAQAVAFAPKDEDVEA